MGEANIVKSDRSEIFCWDNSDFESENDTHITNIEHLIKSLQSGDLQNGLVAYSRAFEMYANSDFLNLTCLEIFVESLVDKAKDFISNKFGMNDFLCAFCGDILLDPITLECGHTYSKHCALFEIKDGNFSCLKCDKEYSHTYLSELKISIFISKFIEKIWKVREIGSTYDWKSNFDAECDLYALFSSIIDSENDLSFKGNPSPKSFLIKGDMLVNSKKYKEAICLYLIYSVFVSNAELVQKRATDILHELLLKSPGTSETYHKEFIEKFEGLQVVKVKDHNILEKFPSQKLNESIEKQELCLLIKKFCHIVEKLAAKNFLRDENNTPVFDKQDFDCSLCMQLFLEPVTTTCGHTFCRRCLCRWFDHKPSCPLCQTPLSNYLSECVRSTSEFIELAIINMFPEDYAERKAAYVEEMEEIFNSKREAERTIPLFVCTVAFPNVCCPLHIYEPRYKLMIRQCMESGSFKFGMCAFNGDNIAEFGTMLEIEDVCYFPDGRSVVYTMGSRRFRILRRGERDGYNTATIEYLTDEVFEENNLFREVHNHMYKTAQRWFMHLSQETKRRILQHFGPMPEIENNIFSKPDGPSWFWWILAVLPIEQKNKVIILSLTSFARRLRALERIFMQLRPSVTTI